MNDVLSDFQNFVDSPETKFPSDSKKDEASFVIENAIKHLLAWKQHQIRTIHQDTARSDIWEHLKDNEVFIILDFAMKWLPTKGRESQQMWFGKCSMSSNSCHCQCN